MGHKSRIATGCTEFEKDMADRDVAEWFTLLDFLSFEGEVPERLQRGWGLLQEAKQADRMHEIPEALRWLDAAKVELAGHELPSREEVNDLTSPQAHGVDALQGSHTD